MFFDSLYVVLVLPAVLLTMIAQIMVKSTFNKYNRVGTRSGLTGREASLAIQHRIGLEVPVNTVKGSLNDHFDPSANVINLSEAVGPVPSVAAIGVAAHETGHAMQYASGYAPIKIRAAIVPATRFASSSAPWIILLGFILSFGPLIYLGIALFGASVLFQLITLPVEFDASRRAMKALESQQILTADELAGARKVLTAAAMTYVAALFLSLMSMLRLILLASGRGRKSR